MRQHSKKPTAKQPHFHGHRQRLKERFAKNAANLADYELLELLLTYVIPRKDTKPQAKALLERFGSLGGVFQAKESVIRTISGLGDATQHFFQLLEECRIRATQTPVAQKVIFSGPDDVSDMVIARLGQCEHEEFWVILVDNKNRLQVFEKVSKGTVDQTPLFPRDVITLALEHQSSGIILVHNHPGGDPTPSPHDIKLTHGLNKLGKEMRLRILDHLIVAENTCYSFVQHGLL